MAATKKNPLPAPAPEEPTRGQLMLKVLEEARTDRIRAALARSPRPSYTQIAFEVGCSEKTVYRVATGKTHAERS